MKDLRRVTGVIIGTLVLHLILLGAAEPCAHSSGAAMSETIAGHDLHDAAANNGTGSRDCDAHADRPSDAPASGAPACIAMISCATPLMQFAVQVSAATAIAATAAHLPPVLPPPSRNTVPETPPPRA